MSRRVLRVEVCVYWCGVVLKSIQLVGDAVGLMRVRSSRSQQVCACRQVGIEKSVDSKTMCVDHGAVLQLRVPVVTTRPGSRGFGGVVAVLGCARVSCEETLCVRVYSYGTLRVVGGGYSAWSPTRQVSSDVVTRRWPVNLSDEREGREHQRAGLPGGCANVRASTCGARLGWARARV